jgi:DNA polymerase-3 subunit epsilon
MKPMDSIIFLDIETTGFSAEKGHEILEFAGMKCHPETLAPFSKYQTMIYPKNGINKGAYEKNHISLDMVKYAAPIEYAIEGISSFIRPGDTLVGHNVKKFDIPFLDFFKEVKFTNKLVDTLEMAKQAGFKYGCLKQEELAEHFGITNEEGKSHRAMYDVEVNWRIYKKLLPMVQGKLF